MALTLRLTDEEKTSLLGIQSSFEAATSSGAIKRMLLDWRKREERISELETMLQECLDDRDKVRSDLNRVKDAWKIFDKLLTLE